MKKLFAALLVILLAYAGGSAIYDDTAPGRRIVRGFPDYKAIRLMEAGNVTLSAGGNTTNTTHSLGVKPNVLLATGNSTDISQVTLTANSTHVQFSVATSAAPMDKTIFYQVAKY